MISLGRLISNYDYAGDFGEEGLAMVAVGGGWQLQLWYSLVGAKYGFIDRAGRYVVEPKYDKVWAFAEGMAEVRLWFAVRN